jgi:hypothetical protein
MLCVLIDPTSYLSQADQSFEKPSVEHTIETLRKVEEKARYREDGVSLSATYERDSIEGPLKDKGEQGKKGPEHHEEIKVNIDIDEVEGPLGANKGHKTGSEEAASDPDYTPAFILE